MAEGGPQKDILYSASVDSGYIGDSDSLPLSLDITGSLNGGVCSLDHTGPLVGGRQIGHSQFFVESGTSTNARPINITVPKNHYTSHSFGTSTSFGDSGLFGDNDPAGNTKTHSSNICDSGYVTGPLENSERLEDSGIFDGSESNTGQSGKFPNVNHVDPLGNIPTSPASGASRNFVPTRNPTCTSNCDTGRISRTEPMDVGRVANNVREYNTAPIHLTGHNTQAANKSIASTEIIFKAEPMDTGGIEERAAECKSELIYNQGAADNMAQHPGGATCNPPEDRNQLINADAVQDLCQFALPQEYSQVPAKCIMIDTRTFLNRRLSPKASSTESMPRDFRGFAQIIGGYDQADINYFDQRYTDPFLAIFDDWLKMKPDITLGHFIDVLGKLRKMDILGSERFQELIGMILVHLLSYNT